jgi:transcriptional regulator with XRE-family HTH domain
MTILQARKALAWSQQDLARRAGVPPITVSQMEAGQQKAWTYITTRRIAKAFQRAGLTGVTEEELFPLPDDEPDVA